MWLLVLGTWTYKDRRKDEQTTHAANSYPSLSVVLLSTNNITLPRHNLLHLNEVAILQKISILGMNISTIFNNTFYSTRNKEDLFSQFQFHFLRPVPPTLPGAYFGNFSSSSIIRDSVVPAWDGISTPEKWKQNTIIFFICRTKKLTEIAEYAKTEVILGCEIEISLNCHFERVFSMNSTKFSHQIYLKDMIDSLIVQVSQNNPCQRVGILVLQQLSDRHLRFCEILISVEK